MWTKRCAAAGLALWAALPAAGASVAATERPSVVVHVDNRAGVPPHDLDRARRELEHVFGAAGVDIKWSDAGFAGAIVASHAAPRRRQLVVMLVNASGEEPRHAAGCPLGYALPSTAMAYVFYNRILALSRSQPVDLDVTLGHVIAHEVGHLLLPPGGHPNYGIMRASLDLTVKNPNRFTDGEARKMQAGLLRSRER